MAGHCGDAQGQTEFPRLGLAWRSVLSLYLEEDNIGSCLSPVVCLHARSYGASSQPKASLSDQSASFGDSKKIEALIQCPL